MNAIEMMTKAIAGQLPELVAKAMQNLPPDVLANIGQIRDIVAAYKGQLDRLESQQRLIMAALNISTEDGDDGHQRKLGNGDGGTGKPGPGIL